jgi:hypothetical protein
MFACVAREREAEQEILVLQYFEDVGSGKQDDMLLS